MKIKRAAAANFLSYGKLEYEYTQQGLTLVEGFDEDLGVSTGTGKSAFLDVVSYGLFGRISKDIVADEVINRQVQKDMFVSIEFDDSGNSYVIERYRKHHQRGNDIVIFKNGEELRGKDMRETQKMVESIVGCSFEVFSKATYFSQFSPIDRFLSASDSEKKKLISEVCDLSFYDGVLEKVKADIKDVNAQLIQISAKYDAANSQRSMLVTKQRKTQEEMAQWDSTHARRIEAVKRDFDSFEQLRISRVKTAEVTLAMRENELGITRQKLEQIGDVTVRKDRSAEKDTIQKKLKTIELLEAKRAELDSKMRWAQNERSSHQAKMRREEIKMANKEPSTCPHCFTFPMSYEHIQKTVDDLRALVEKCDVAITQLQTSIAAIDQGLQVKLQLQQQLDQISREEHAEAIKVMEAQQLTELIAAQTNVVENARVEVENQKLAQNPYVVTIERLKEEKNPYKAIDLSSDIAEVDAAIQKFAAEMVVLQNRIQLANWWKDAFAIYIRSYLMDAFLEQINEKANEYLDALFDGVLQIDIQSTTEKGKEVKEKISVTIMMGGDECSYESLSGGERCRICLAVNLALSDLTSKMSAKSFNILMLDEIFTGLDESGKNQTMKLLKSLESRFDSIFVVDHTEAFKSMFSNVVNIRKKSRMSSVEKMVV